MTSFAGIDHDCTFSTAFFMAKFQDIVPKNNEPGSTTGSDIYFIWSDGKSAHIFNSQTFRDKKMKLFFVLTIGSIHGLPYPKFEWEEVKKFSKIPDSS